MHLIIWQTLWYRGEWLRVIESRDIPTHRFQLLILLSMRCEHLIGHLWFHTDLVVIVVGGLVSLHLGGRGLGLLLLPP